MLHGAKFVTYHKMALPNNAMNAMKLNYIREIIDKEMLQIRCPS